MSKIISFAVWGKDPMYKIGVIENLKLKEYYYPDWDVVIYAEDMSEPWIKQALIYGAKILPLGNYSGWKNSLVRYLPCVSDNIVIVRDADSRFTMREVDAVNQWLASDKDMHVMRDHPWHNERVMGGMCGFRNGIFKKHEPDLYNWLTNHVNERLIAEKFFDNVYSEEFNNIYFNISHNAFENEVHHPFIERKFGEFVGEIFDQNNNRHPTHYQILL